jgi:SAM-dependent methyltransferase
MTVSLKNNLQCIEMPDKFMQTCPLCGERHPMMIRGIVHDIENGKPAVAVNKGYSFCNCYNIFYTDWKNINQNIYDESYVEKYKSDEVKKISKSEINKFLRIAEHHKKEINSFLEIGSIHDHILDELPFKGVGLDIVGHDSKHPFIVANFEHYEGGKYDVIYASHVFEHFEDVSAQLLKCKEMLNKGGWLYIAMPDTFFIDWDDYMKWDWFIEEHHVLWSMDSFIDFAEERGFKCVFSERSTDLFKRENYWFWKQDFKVILSND